MRGQKGQIHDAIRKAKTVTVDELRASTSINYNTIRGILVALTNAGMIERVERGVYKIAKENR